MSGCMAIEQWDINAALCEWVLWIVPGAWTRLVSRGTHCILVLSPLCFTEHAAAPFSLSVFRCHCLFKFEKPVLHIRLAKPICKKHWMEIRLGDKTVTSSSRLDLVTSTPEPRFDGCFKRHSHKYGLVSIIVSKGEASRAYDSTLRWIRTY